MENTRFVIKNMSSLLVAQVIGLSFQFAGNVVLIRNLNSKEFGEFSFSWVLVGMFGLFIEQGFGVLLVRDVSKDKALAPLYLGNILGLKAVFSFLALGGMIWVPAYLGYPEELRLVILFLGIKLVLDLFCQTYYSLLRAYERMSYEGLLSALMVALNLMTIVLVIWWNKDIVSLSIALCLPSLVILILLNLVLSKRFFQPSLRPDGSVCKTILKGASPLGLGAIFYFIYNRIDILMISSMIDMEAVGYYNAAYRFIDVLWFIPNVFYGAIFPWMSRMQTSSLDSLKEVSQKACRYMAILGFFIAAVVTVESEKIVALLLTSNLSLCPLGLSPEGPHLVDSHFLRGKYLWFSANFRR